MIKKTTLLIGARRREVLNKIANKKATESSAIDYLRILKQKDPNEYNLSVKPTVKKLINDNTPNRPKAFGRPGHNEILDNIILAFKNTSWKQIVQGAIQKQNMPKDINTGDFVKKAIEYRLEKSINNKS